MMINMGVLFLPSGSSTTIFIVLIFYYVCFVNIHCSSGTLQLLSLRPSHVMHDVEKVAEATHD